MLPSSSNSVSISCNHRRFNAVGHDWLSSLIFIAIFISPHVVIAQVGPGVAIQRDQDTRIEQARSRFHVESDRLVSKPDTSDPSSVLVEEAQCFEIRRIDLAGAAPYPWFPEQVVRFGGHCMGVASLKNLRDYLTLLLLEKGFVTTRVTYPKQKAPRYFKWVNGSPVSRR